MGRGFAVSHGGQRDLNRSLRENAQIQSKTKIPFKLVDEVKLIVYLVGPRATLETLSVRKRLPQKWGISAEVKALPVGG